MKGIELLLTEYAKAGISLKLKSENIEIAIVRGYHRLMRLNPEEIHSREVQTMPHRTVLTYNSCLLEQSQINLIQRALMQKLKYEIMAETQTVIQKTV